MPLQLLIGMFSDGVNSLKELANQRKARASDLSSNTGARRVGERDVVRFFFFFIKCAFHCFLVEKKSFKPNYLIFCCAMEPCFRRGSTFLCSSHLHSRGCTVCCHSNCKSLNIAPVKGLIELDCDAEPSLKFIVLHFYHHFPGGKY